MVARGMDIISCKPVYIGVRCRDCFSCLKRSSAGISGQV
ncbi:hypothetical protein MTY_0819 [Moorella thermoacetica Y72]|uniref:Uncharacterized protein n=1 Tax=Moorella thermoacetica Y72 TaxID=1325331 RepID=A0A0S6UBD5_NEOTH|nr:hypothetical protein MTY_0819 [Moorella thermoacetica Y72]